MKSTAFSWMLYLSECIDPPKENAFPIIKCLEDRKRSFVNYQASFKELGSLVQDQEIQAKQFSRSLSGLEFSMGFMIAGAIYNSTYLKLIG
jgi:hypothetical protein